MIYRDSWNPKLFEFLFNGNFLERRELYRHLEGLCKDFNGKILDVGCGTKPYIKLFKKGVEYVGLDIADDLDKIKGGSIIKYDGKIFPLKDNEFDGVVSFQAIYQSEDINLTMKEINRVIKQQGNVLISVPFMWFDSQSHTEARFGEYDIKNIFTKNGFEIVRTIKTNPNLSAIFLLLNVYIAGYLTKPKNKIIVRILKLLFLPITFSLNGLGLLSIKFLPKTEYLYIDTVILARKISDVKK